MELLRFVNSKDIRKHLKSIGYEFNTLEAAWLIYQCRDATINEKHKAWKKLIETMPDCPIERRCNTLPQESLHAFLKSYMELENRFLDEFYDEKHTDTFDYNKPYVYKFEYIYKNGTINNWSTVFSRFDAIFETIMEPDENVVSIKCTKIQIDRLNQWPQITYLTPNFDFLSFDPGCIENRNEADIYLGVFDGLWFDFPTPFHKGDIVWDPKSGKGFCKGPFSLNSICLEGIQHEKTQESIRKSGDSSDMCAVGYFLNEDGSIYPECMSNYMDLEFYEKELIGKQRTLISLSNFLKGKIDIGLFAEAYHQIITTGYAYDSMPQSYDKSGLIFAGLAKE